MTLFLWVLIVLATLSCIGKVIWLANGELPRRQPASEAIDVVVNAALVVWAVALLVRG
jgi:hypothetical protein